MNLSVIIFKQGWLRNHFIINERDMHIVKIWFRIFETILFRSILFTPKI